MIAFLLAIAIGLYVITTAFEATACTPRRYARRVRNRQCGPLP